MQQTELPATEPQIIDFVASPKLKRLRGVTLLSLYGFWFLTGVAIANLSRFIPHGWVLYWVLIAAAAGYLLLVKSVEEESTATRRLAGVALALSCIAFWDTLLTVFTLPIHVFNWILPVWMVGLLVGFSLVFLVILIAIIS